MDMLKIWYCCHTESLVLAFHKILVNETFGSFSLGNIFTYLKTFPKTLGFFLWPILSTNIEFYKGQFHCFARLFNNGHLVFFSGFKRRAPRAIKEIRKFAEKMMGTPDVRVDTRLNKHIWSQGVRYVVKW